MNFFTQTKDQYKKKTYLNLKNKVIDIMARKFVYIGKLLL